MLRDKVCRRENRELVKDGDQRLSKIYLRG
jgi:hypothetical protein